MSTTIQVEGATKELLEHLKRNTKARSYDEVIRALAVKKGKSLYGSLAGKRKVSKKTLLSDLRDKEDR